MSATADTRPARVSVDESTCIACGRCIQICPMDVFRRDNDGKPIVVYESDCSQCFLCWTDCPPKCITIDVRMPANFTSIYDYLEIPTPAYAGPLNGDGEDASPPAGGAGALPADSEVVEEDETNTP